MSYLHLRYTYVDQEFTEEHEIMLPVTWAYVALIVGLVGIVAFFLLALAVLLV